MIRRRSLLQIYSDLYYTAKLQGLLSAEVKSHPNYVTMSTSERGALQLNTYRKIRSTSWEAESQEVKAEVMEIYEAEQKKGKTGKKGTTTMKGNGDTSGIDELEMKEQDHQEEDERTFLERQQEYAHYHYFFILSLFLYRCQDIIGSVLTSVLGDATSATGYAFFIIGGGLDKKGELKIAT